VYVTATITSSRGKPRRSDILAEPTLDTMRRFRSPSLIDAIASRARPGGVPQTVHPAGSGEAFRMILRWLVRAVLVGAPLSRGRPLGAGTIGWLWRPALSIPS
jgi:hypothetical protein